MTTSPGANIALVVETLLEDPLKVVRVSAPIELRAQEYVANAWSVPSDMFRVQLSRCETLTLLLSESGCASGCKWRHQAVALIDVRAMYAAKDVLYLLRGGLVDAAVARTRTLHELRVAATLVSRAEALAERYLSFTLVDKLKFAKDHGDTSRISSLEREIAAERVKFDDPMFDKENGWARPLFPSHAGRVQFSEMEKAAHLEHLRPRYGAANHPTHGGAYSLVAHVAGMAVPEEFENRWPPNIRLIGHAWPAEWALQALAGISERLVQVAAPSDLATRLSDRIAEDLDATIDRYYECEADLQDTHSAVRHPGQ